MARNYLGAEKAFKINSCMFAVVVAKCQKVKIFFWVS